MNPEFFVKYKVTLSEGDALRVIENQVRCVQEAYLADGKSDEYLKELAKLREQISDFFEAIEKDIDEYSVVV